MILATAPTEDLGDASLTVRFSSPGGQPTSEVRLPFAKASQVTGTLFEFSLGGFAPQLKMYPLTDFASEAARGDDSSARFDLAAQIRTNSGKARFGLRNLRSKDTLYVMALSQQLSLADVFHGRRPPVMTFGDARCIATCADGTSAEKCVTCTEDGITVKVCC